VVAFSPGSDGGPAPYRSSYHLVATELATRWNPTLGPETQLIHTPFFHIHSLANLSKAQTAHTPHQVHTASTLPVQSKTDLYPPPEPPRLVHPFFSSYTCTVDSHEPPTPLRGSTPHSHHPNSRDTSAARGVFLGLAVFGILLCFLSSPSYFVETRSFSLFLMWWCVSRFRSTPHKTPNPEFILLNIINSQVHPSLWLFPLSFSTPGTPTGGRVGGGVSHDDVQHQTGPTLRPKTHTATGGGLVLGFCFALVQFCFVVERVVFFMGARWWNGGGLGGWAPLPPQFSLRGSGGSVSLGRERVLGLVWLIFLSHPRSPFAGRGSMLLMCGLWS